MAIPLPLGLCAHTVDSHGVRLWEKFMTIFFSMGNNSACRQGKVMNLVLRTSPYCHLLTYKSSRQYLEQSWSYAADNIYTKFF